MIVKLYNRCTMEAQHIMEIRQQVKDLRGERDEARRSLCECRASGGFDSHDGDWFADDGRHILARLDAAERGWDCFKDSK